MASSYSRELILRWAGDVSALKQSTTDVKKIVDKSADNAEAAGDKAGKGFGGKFSGGIKSVAKKLAVGLGALFAFDKIKEFAKQAYDEAREAQKVGAQTNAVIKSTGGVARVTAKQVSDLATAISNKTGIDDEQIQTGQNMLLTFTNIRNGVGKNNKIFDQATSIMTDMSVATGKDMTGSAVMLGKALNNPTKGISALTRVGVSFTEGQQKQIKALQASGDTMGAQKIILGELRKEFGGSAAAQATAGEKLTTTWKNFQEEVGTAVLPVIDKLMNLLSQKLLPALSKLFELMLKHKRTVAIVAGLIAAIALAMKTAAFFTEAFSVATKGPAAAQWLFNAAMDANPIGLIVIALAALVAGLILAYKHSATFRKIVNETWTTIKKTALTVLDWFRNKFLPFFSKTLPDAFKSIIGWLRKNWPTILAIITGPIGLAVLAIVKHWDKIKKTFQGIKDWVSSTWRKGWSAVSGWMSDSVGKGRDRAATALHAVRTRFGDLKSWVGSTWKKGWTSVKGWLSDAVASGRDRIGNALGPDGVRKRFANLKDWVSGAWRKGWSSAKDWIAHPVQNAREAIGRQRDLIKTALTNLDDWGRHTFGPKRWSKIRDTLTKPFSLAKEAIQKILGKKGLYKAIGDALDRLAGLWKKITNPIGNAIKGMLKIVNIGLIKNGINWLLGKMGVDKKHQLPWIPVNLPKLASGGLLRGRGGRRDDKNLALLSNREYVQPTDAVDYYGVRTMDRLRRRAIPKDLLIHGYAGGGLVGGSGRWTREATQALIAASTRAGTNFSVFQRGFRPATSYSGTSHAKDAIDTGPVREAVWKALRDVGWAAWDRTGKGNWAPHIHAIPIPGKGVGTPGGSGVWQAADYLRGGDGLGGKDYHSYRPGLAQIGGILAGAIGGVASFLGKLSPIQWLTKKVTDFAGKAGIGGGLFGRGMLSKLPGLILSRAKGWLDKKFGLGGGWSGGAVGGWNKEQLGNAATIINVARSLGFGNRGAQIALITAMQESTLRNLNYGDRDSLGLFQQRAPWGPASARTNPTQAARMFLLGGQGGQRGLKSFPWRSMGLAAAAQAVQVSAFPGAYAKWIDDAAAILSKFQTMDRGGRLPRGISLINNGTGQTERVLSPAEERSIAGTTIINIYVDGTMNDDRTIGRLIQQIEAYQRRRGPVKIRRAAA